MQLLTVRKVTRTVATKRRRTGLRGDDLVKPFVASSD